MTRLLDAVALSRGPGNTAAGRRAVWVPLKGSPPEPPPGRRRRGLLFLALLAGLLAFCHGCHGDVDDELSSLGWWVSAGK